MTSKVDKKDFEQYLRETKTWEVKRVVRSIASQRLAWIVASIACVVAVCNSLTSTLLATREPDPPVVLRVNEATGAVDIVARLQGGDTTYDEVVNKYWIEAYIRFREGYLRATADENYNAVGLMSCGGESRKYADSFSPKNPGSPLNLYGETTKVKVNIKGTSLIKSNVALTRFTKEVERPGADRPDVSNWAATTVFKYSGAPMKEKDRRVNPLGFQACEYRIDPDSATGDSRPIVSVSPLATPPQTVTPGLVLFPGSAPAPVLQVPAILSNQ